MKTPTKAEVLAQLDAAFGKPLAYVSVEAFQMGADFNEGLPDLAAEAGADADGWAVHVERQHRLEKPATVKVLVSAGVPLAEALAHLDRIRDELVRRGEVLLSDDWSRPLPERPRLRVVKPEEGDSDG
jgi:hypothetical protein